MKVQVDVSEKKYLHIFSHMRPFIFPVCFPEGFIFLDALPISSTLILIFAEVEYVLNFNTGEIACNFAGAAAAAVFEDQLWQFWVSSKRFRREKGVLVSVVYYDKLMQRRRLVCIIILF